MKPHKNFILIFIIFSGLFFVESLPEPRNPPIGNTGAPGETTCMFVGCHNGGTFTGTVEISGIPDTVIANQLYDVTITNKSDAVRSGFQLTVLDALNKFTGTLIKGTGVNIAKDNFTGKQYARQEFAIFLNNGSASWNFQWQAPASVLNDSMTFYFVSMCANGDGNNSKDNSVKNKKRVIFKMPVANKELQYSRELKLIFYRDLLMISNGEFMHDGLINIYNLNGDLIYKTNYDGSMIALSQLIPGMYLVNLESSSGSYVGKFSIL